MAFEGVDVDGSLENRKLLLFTTNRRIWNGRKSKAMFVETKKLVQAEEGHHI